MTPQLFFFFFANLVYIATPSSATRHCRQLHQRNNSNKHNQRYLRLQQSKRHTCFICWWTLLLIETKKSLIADQEGRAVQLSAVLQCQNEGLQTGQHSGSLQAGTDHAATQIPFIVATCVDFYFVWVQVPEYQEADKKKLGSRRWPWGAFSWLWPVFGGYSSFLLLSSVRISCHSLLHV